MDNPFEAFRLPVGLTSGVEIPIPNTPAVFTVKLPCRSDDEFQMMVLAGLNVIVKDEHTAQVQIDPMEFQNKRKRIFLETRIVSATGLPEGMNPQEFLREYPLIGKYLFKEADRLSVIADQQVEEALGNFSSLPNGKPSGKDDTNSMSASPAPVFQSARENLN
jgi:hypothetical protein